MTRAQLNKHYGRAVVDAVDYIGSHRKTGTYPRRKSCPVSMRTVNKLFRLRLAMWLEEDKSVMLTLNGERLFTQLHPYSKYAIK